MSRKILLWIKHCWNQYLSRVTGISTPVGGISWKQKSTNIERCCETIHITSRNNDNVIELLNRNDRKIIFIDTTIDASISTKEQFEISEMEKVNATASELNGIPLPLPNDSGYIVTITFNLDNNHKLYNSHGGTGINTIYINGFFEVTRTFHGGPMISFNLKEINASMEERIDMLNLKQT